MPFEQQNYAEKARKSESMAQNLANEMSTLVQVMTQSRYARNHRLG